MALGLDPRDAKKAASTASRVVRSEREFSTKFFFARCARKQFYPQMTQMSTDEGCGFICHLWPSAAICGHLWMNFFFSRFALKARPPTMVFTEARPVSGGAA